MLVSKKSLRHGYFGLVLQSVELIVPQASLLRLLDLLSPRPVVHGLCPVLQGSESTEGAVDHVVRQGF